MAWHDKLAGDRPLYYGTVDDEGKAEVYRGDHRKLDRRSDLRNHSPSGFNWGYGGSGPAQLALAMLADFLGDDELAQEHYQNWKFHFVGRLRQGESWKITKDEMRVTWHRFYEDQIAANQSRPQ